MEEEKCDSEEPKCRCGDKATARIFALAHKRSTTAIWSAIAVLSARTSARWISNPPPFLAGQMASVMDECGVMIRKCLVD